MLTMTASLARAERIFAQRSATIDRRAAFTWAEHITRVRRAAGILAAHGLKRGDRFAVIALNSHLYSEILHAGYWAGFIPVPINYRLAASEIRQILDDANCKLLTHCNAFAKVLETPALAHLRAHALNLEGDYADRLKHTEPMMPQDAQPDDLALLLFTGGTTGCSKGVRLTHGNIVANGMQVALAMRATADDRYLHIAPMFHAADLLGTAFTLVGASHAYVSPFGGDSILTALQDFRATVCMMTPTMIVMTVQHPDITRYDLSRFRLLFYGSAPLDPIWIRRAMERFAGVELQGSYGLTETAPILTTLDPEAHARAARDNDDTILRAVGRPVVGVDLTVRNGDGVEVPIGTVGEVVVRGPNVAAGYLDRPAETAAAFKNGWFYTGDIGRLDDTGTLFLVDRKKDMVITGGENVYTTEVEGILHRHPDVHEAAVIGVPDDKYGETLLAIIVPAAGKPLSTDDIVDHCRGRIGAYKIPRKVEFVSELPKSAMGKILKTELRRIYAGRTTKF